MPSPEDLPNPDIEPMPPALQVYSLLWSHCESPKVNFLKYNLHKIWYGQSF